MRDDTEAELGSAGYMRASPPRRFRRAEVPMRELANKWSPRNSWLAFLVVASILLTAIFTALDPGPSRGLGALGRLLFWTAHVMIPLALLQTAQMALSRTKIVSRLHAWVQIVLSGLIGVALFTPIALLFDQAFAVAETVKETGETVARQLATEFASFLPTSILVWSGLNASRLLRLDGAVARSPAPATSSELRDPATEFWQRLPMHLGRDLVALTAEQHYLRVYTTLCDTLILYSFGRAVEELGARGHQVHRSHWIAEGHLAAVDRDGDRYVCRTETGLRIPLSRPHRRKIRDLCMPEPM